MNGPVYPDGTPIPWPHIPIPRQRMPGQFSPTKRSHFERHEGGVPEDERELVREIREVFRRHAKNMHPGRARTAALVAIAVEHRTIQQEIYNPSAAVEIEARLKRLKDREENG